MLKPRHSRRIKLAAAAVASVALTMSFQNCGKAGFDGADPTLGGSFSSSLKSGLPFAYDATFDQISYNSCFGAGTAGKPGFHSLMAGAYDTGGVRVTENFMTQARTSGVIKPEYPLTTVTDEQIKIHLAQSAENVSAQPQMALRTRSNVQQVRTPGGTAGTEGLDFITMLGDLTDDRWMDPLVRKNSAMNNFFNLAPEYSRNLEARLSYQTDEGMADLLRQDLRSNGMLALTFKTRPDLGTSTMARTPDSADARKAYGRGYLLTFDYSIAPYTEIYSGGGNPQPHPLNPSYVLSDVKEIDLQNPSSQSGTSWTCPKARRYLIIDVAHDLYPVTHATVSLRGKRGFRCPTDPHTYMLTGISGVMSAQAYRREYEIVRRHLKPEFWDVSIAYRCAVPKEGSCYPPEMLNGQVVVPEFDQRQPCFQGLPGIPYSNPIPTKRCAHYVSICNRNN